MYSGLMSVSIGNSVTSIGDSAFYGCSGLTTVTIPNSVTSIGYSAFYGCSGLTTVTIPNSVTSIGSSAFCGCSGLMSVSIPNSVTSIGNYAFWGCSGLMSVSIGNSVTSIGDGAFGGCSSLNDVQISDLTAWCNIDFGNELSNPLYYADLLYLNEEFVTNLVIPNETTKVKAYAFYGYKCLNSVTIPNSVTSISEYAFCRCEGLTMVTIGNSVATIDYYAFGECYEITSVICKRKKAIVAGKDIFSDYTYNATLYVPIGTKLAYELTEPWKYFSNIVESEAAGVDDVIDDNEIRVVDGAISVSSESQVRIVSLSGVTIYNGQGNCSVDVAKGVYVVSVGDKATKVSVK